MTLHYTPLRFQSFMLQVWSPAYENWPSQRDVGLCFLWKLSWLEPPHPKRTTPTQINACVIATLPVLMWIQPYSWLCRRKNVPGDETGSCQVREGVDHSDHQRDHHNTGIYDVQLGAEINFEPERQFIKQNTRRLTCCRENHTIQPFVCARIFIH